MSFTSIDQFWTSFGNSIRARNIHINIPPIKSAYDFRAFLENANKDLFHGWRVVLFIDEFHNLGLHGSQDVIDSVLDLFRDMKHKQNSYLLQVFLPLHLFPRIS